MTQTNALKIAQISIRANRGLLKSLGDEKKVKLAKNPDEDIIKKLLDIMPKSTEGKLLALGVVVVAGYLLLKSK
jgi:hypothetical protein